MARRDENECAHCAEEMELNARCVGQDWKVYCSTACQQAGEKRSASEHARCMAVVTDRRAVISLSAVRVVRAPGKISVR